MNLLHLQYFCAIAKEENISRTAEKLNIAQSALSKALSSLEADLGIHLFDRVGKYIKLNDDGRLLYQQCSYAFALINDAEKRIRNRDEWQEGEVVVCADSLSPYLPELIQQFHRHYPRVRLKLAQAFDGMSLRASGEFDVSITDHYSEQKEDQGPILCRDEFVLLLPKTHPLAGAQEVDLAQMREESFVYCCRVGDTLNGAYDSLCCMAGFTPKVFLVGADLSITVASIRAGQGVAFVPASAIAVMPERMRDEVAMVKIRAPYYANPIFIVTPSGKVLSAAAELFISYIKEYFESIYTDGVCSLENGLILAEHMKYMVFDYLPPVPEN